MKHTIWILAMFAALSASAPAQERNLLAQYPAQACPKAASIVKSLIDKYPHPTGWLFVVVCDDTTWEKLLYNAGNGRADYIFGATVLAKKTTLFRGTRIEHPRAVDGDPGADHTVSHELAHIYLRSHDDATVDKLSLEWMEERHASSIR
jgi:hypothetical protein